MGREAIINHIQRELRSPETYDGESDEIVCQNCGSPIHEGGQFVIHCVPEHGKDGSAFVFYCDRDCFNDHIRRLIDQ